MALSHQARLNGVVILKIDGAVHEILMKNMWPLGHMWPSFLYFKECFLNYPPTSPLPILFILIIRLSRISAIRSHKRLYLLFHNFREVFFSNNKLVD